jgi:hypothetical protein
VTPDDAVRVAGWCAQAEIALVMRSAVAASLLAQAARAADGLPGGGALAVAAKLARTVDITATEPEPAACRKVVQALCRVGLQEAQAALLAPRP